MAFPVTSYVSGPVLAKVLDNTFNLTTSTIKAALYTDLSTGLDKNTAQAYSATAEVATSGDYAAKGGTPGVLNTPTWTASGGKIIFDEADATMVWTGVTWTGTGAPRGVVIFDDTPTATPVADPILAAINFGSDKAVTSGTFTITWDSTNGIFYASY